MLKEPQFTISGLRGVWGENLTEDIARSHINAFAIFLQKRNTKRIIIGRDGRESGPIIAKIATDILVRAGFEVVNTDVIPTPTIIFLIREEKFDAGIMLTASHNPREYNGIKFLTDKAFYVNQDEVNEIKSYLGQLPESIPGGNILEKSELGLKHVTHVVKNVDIELISSKKYKVVIDTINGAGSTLGTALLRALSADVVAMNNTPNGDFAHIPEPLPENLTTLGEKVREVGADIGFALDPDADRLVVCDEKGEIIFEEYTLSLAIKNVLAKTPGDIVINLSTSNTNEDLANEAGHKAYHTKVGEGNVVAGIIAHSAVIGGEGGGGVIYPKINICRDSLTGMALILELLARDGKPISQIVESLPKYVLLKTKMPFSGNLKETMEKIVALFKDGKPDTQDGLRIDFTDRSWVQIRASNTEPIIRIFAEAKTKDRAEELISLTKSCLV